MYADCWQLPKYVSKKKKTSQHQSIRESASTSFLKKRRSQMCSLSRIKNSNIDIIHLLYTTRPSSFRSFITLVQAVLSAKGGQNLYIYFKAGCNPALLGWEGWGILAYNECKCDAAGNVCRCIRDFWSAIVLVHVFGACPASRTHYRAGFATLPVQHTQYVKML